MAKPQRNTRKPPKRSWWDWIVPFGYSKGNMKALGVDKKNLKQTGVAYGGKVPPKKVASYHATAPNRPAQRNDGGRTFDQLQAQMNPDVDFFEKYGGKYQQRKFDPGILPPLQTRESFLAAINPAFEQAQRRINEKFSAISTELGNREVRNRDTLALMPAEWQRTHDTGRQNVANFGNSALAAAQAASLPMDVQTAGYVPEVAAAPFVNTLNTMQADRQADVPLLQLGNQQMIGGQKAQAEMARAEELADVERQRQEALLRFEEMRMQQQAERDQLIARANMDQSAEWQGKLLEAQLQYDMARDPRTDPDLIEERQNYDTIKQTKLASSQRGLLMTRYEPKRAAVKRNTDMYRFLSKALADGDVETVQYYRYRWPEISSLVFADARVENADDDPRLAPRVLKPGEKARKARRYKPKGQQAKRR